ncbi:MAG: hypothetical protein ACXAEX_16375 [Promethearchaeota archaeon]|jgi:hypothetical protein
MRYLRVLFGILVSGIIIYSDDSPIMKLFDLLRFPQYLKFPLFFLLVGVIAGVIAGSYIMGAISCIVVIILGVIIPLLVFSSGSFFLESFIRGFMKIGLIEIIMMVAGGLIGGYVVDRYFEDEEYIILNVDDQFE